MSSVNFLKRELEAISSKFPFVHIKYGYDWLIESHLVELSPLNEYNNNKDLDASWIPLSINFIEQFDEEITFFSSDSDLSIEKVIFEFNANSSSEEKIINELFAPISGINFKYFFSTDNIGNGRIILNSSITVLDYPVENLDNDDSPECPSYLAAA